jgi:RNA polymerase sigma-70 factor (ECF subfamily)
VEGAHHVVARPDGTSGPTAPQRPSATSESAEFSECYAVHFHSLAVQLFAHTGDAAEAQDVVQEAFCKALARWHQVATYDDPAAWVRRVAWNLATSRRRRVRTAMAFASQHRDEPVAGPTPDRLAIVAAIAQLPEHQRRAVVLHYIADLTVSAIAAELDVPEGTVKSWLSRARAILARQLADCEPAVDSDG